MRRKRNKANGPETTARLLYKAQASISPKMATIMPMCRKKINAGLPAWKSEPQEKIQHHKNNPKELEADLCKKQRILKLDR